MTPIAQNNFDFDLSAQKLRISEPPNRQKPKYFSRRLKYRKSFERKPLPSIDKNGEIHFMNFPKPGVTRKSEPEFDISKYKKPEKEKEKEPEVKM